ncbi:hypothetical protein CPAV1605_635 [seawater metagenome]|uniref:Uncharacterized protein n=1 Tax=seawater metagenome TaxID=1561972 RepID=A0A5E8CM82_9ZZZZ
MIYCSLEDAWGKESFQNHIDKYDYQNSLSTKKNIESFQNSKKEELHKRRKKKENMKVIPKKELSNDIEIDYEIDDILESDIDSNTEISDEYDTQPHLFFKSKKEKKIEEYIKKLQQQNIFLKKKILKLGKNKTFNNDFITTLLSDKNREVLILALCGIIIVILVHIITKS